MELLKFIYGSRIEDIPLLDLESLLSKIQSKLGNLLVIPYGNRLTNIKCIREYYLDPITKKKMQRVNMVNPCTSIHCTFNIQFCDPSDCKSCHIQMIRKYYEGKAFLIKSNKK